MRSFASLVLALACVLAPAWSSAAQSTAPKALYNNALVREQALRREMNSARSEPDRSSLLRRMRSLVETYDRMSRQFPASGYMDNALWQGALLAADAFKAFGQHADRTTALRMFEALASRFPTSSLVRQSAAHVRRLNEARPAPAPPARASSTPPPAASALTTLTAVRRDVLGDTVRITLELGQEVAFRAERIAGPPRVFIDLEGTQVVDAIKDATIPFADDVVRQVRIGRHADARTRVVMDLAAAGRHSVYALYNPYRVVVDFERTAPAAAAIVQAAMTDTDVTAAASPAMAPAVAPAVGETASETGPAETTPADAVPDLLAVEETPPAAVAEAAPPSPPTLNRSGSFSLSRQLGLGVSRIVIDAGHGGHDPGAKTRGLTEADLVLDVALRLEQLLQKHDGFEVVLTRRVDTFVPLEERTAIANRAGADLFLSIHANASANTAARGVETYFLNLAANPEAEAVAARENAASARSMSQLPDIVRAIALNNKIEESRDFAAMVQSALATQIRRTDPNVRNLGVKQAPFMVLLGATMPSVLAEISFITNQKDAALLKTDTHRQRIAEALLAGIVRYQQSLKRAPAIAEQ